MAANLPLSSATATYDDLLARTDGPAGSTWGLFDHDRERGMADLAGPAEVRGALSSVTRGDVVSLDYPLDAFDPPLGPDRRALQHTITARHPQARDDRIDSFYLQASSQVDGLRHRRAQDHGFYDGHGDGSVAVGTSTLGVQRWAQNPIVGRGVLLDIEGLRAAEGRPLDHTVGEQIRAVDLDRAAERQEVSLKDGDLGLVHTGWAAWYLGLDRREQEAVRIRGCFTGLVQHRSVTKWVWDRRLATLASDTFAVECLPAADDSEFLSGAGDDAGLMHQELIALLGVPLGELWRLSELADACRTDGRWTSLVVVKPLHLVGGVGSPANATAVR